MSFLFFFFFFFFLSFSFLFSNLIIPLLFIFHRTCFFPLSSVCVLVYCPYIMSLSTLPAAIESINCPIMS